MSPAGRYFIGPIGGALVPALVEVVGRVHQRYMRERLREVPQQALADRVVLLAQEADVVGQDQQPLEEGGGFVASAGQHEVVGQPERAGEEATLARRETVDMAAVGRVPQHESLRRG